MIISEPYKYVYVGIPKTASSSMHWWLVNKYSGSSLGRQHGWQIPKDILRAGDYNIFTVVRDPYDWCFSKWMWNCRINRDNGGAFPQHMEFVEFIEQVMEYRDRGGDPVSPSEMHMSQTEYYRRSGAQQFIKFESLPEGLKELSFVNSDQAWEHNNQFPHFKKSKGELFWNYYDSYFGPGNHEMNIVWEYCGEDFETFDY